MILETNLLAYKYVASALMAAFVNNHSHQLNLPFEVPLNANHSAQLTVENPVFKTNYISYGCGYSEKNYELGFDAYYYNHSNLTGGFTITKFEPDGMTSFGISLLQLHEPSNSLMERASKMEYKITNTNELYHVATNYLMGLGIDAKALEKQCPVTLDEYSVFHSKKGLVPSPLKYAMWGRPLLRDPGTNGVAMKISAVSGDLLELNAGIFSGGHFPLIKDLDKLLTIPDEEFLKFSDMERSNLVVQFAAVHYPAINRPAPNPTTAASVRPK